MASSPQSLFRAAALASGLVDPAQLEEALAAVEPKEDADEQKPERAAKSLRAAQPEAADGRRPGVESGSSQSPVEVPTKPAPTDRLLADKLVAMNVLNRWQAEQLAAGRSKFNLGEYQIIDSIGQGGMGQVFKAVHTLLGRVEAIKVLPRSKSTPEAIDAFLREIRAQAQLDHPNLVRVSYAGRDGNVYFLVTEYIAGSDLRRLVRTGQPMNMEQAASIISQAAEGLHYAHQRGLIHRDVKPGNILVSPEGFAKVSDLGLAAFHEDESDDPRIGKVVGTADYLSPEQILSPRSIGAASDIYGLGCTLYYAVTGKVPYPGGTVKEKVHRHCNDTPLHPRLANPKLSDEFVEVIAAMMEKDPMRRIASGEDVIARLAPWTSTSSVVPPPVQQSAESREPPALHDLDDTDPGFPSFERKNKLENSSDTRADAADDTPGELPSETVGGTPGETPGETAGETAGEMAGEMAGDGVQPVVEEFPIAEEAASDSALPPERSGSLRVSAGAQPRPAPPRRTPASIDGARTPAKPAAARPRGLRTDRVPAASGPVQADESTASAESTTSEAASPPAQHLPTVRIPKIRLPKIRIAPLLAATILIAATVVGVTVAILFYWLY